MPRTSISPAAAFLATALLGAALATTPANAQKKYDTGATDTEIKIGQPHAVQRAGVAPTARSASARRPTSRRSTPTAASTAARSTSSPMTTPTRRPRRSNRRASWWSRRRGAAASSTRSARPPNSAIQKYMNEKKVPQLFVATGATKWGDPKHFPWTMGWQPDLPSRGAHLRQVLLSNIRTPRSPCCSRTTTTARTT